jgi:hypothetical protein
MFFARLALCAAPALKTKVRPSSLGFFANTARDSEQKAVPTVMTNPDWPFVRPAGCRSCRMVLALWYEWLLCCLHLKVIGSTLSELEGSATAVIIVGPSDFLLRSSPVRLCAFSVVILLGQMPSAMLAHAPSAESSRRKLVSVQRTLRTGLINFFHLLRSPFSKFKVTAAPPAVGTVGATTGVTV